MDKLIRIATLGITLLVRQLDQPDLPSFVVGALAGAIAGLLIALGVAELASWRADRRWARWQRERRTRPGGPDNPLPVGSLVPPVGSLLPPVPSCYRPGEGPYRSHGVLRNLEGGR